MIQEATRGGTWRVRVNKKPWFDTALMIGFDAYSSEA